MNISQANVSIINKFLVNFKELFSHKQFTALSMFVYAALADYKRFNLSALSSKLNIDYQALQYFFSESDWNYQSLNTARINLFKRQRTTSFTKEGCLVIDDTGSLKPYAKKTEGVGYQYCPSLKSQGYCNVAVVSCYVNNSKHIPLNLKFYKPAAEFRLGEYDTEFKSKLDFAKDLFDEAIKANISFSYTLFDSWYASSEYMEYIHQNNRYFITEIKADRLLLFKDPRSGRNAWLKQDELVKLVKSYLWHKAGFSRYKDSSLPVYCFTTRLKNCSVPIKAFVVFDKFSEQDSKDVRVLISNNLRLSLKNVVSLYMQRWGIEEAFRELKDSFHFDHYQIRHQEKIMRHWMLSFLLLSLVLWVKLNGCLSKILRYRPLSLNQYKNALSQLIWLSYTSLSMNKSIYFDDIASQRFKNICLCG